MTPKNAQNCPKIWDIYKKLGIDNGEIGAVMNSEKKMRDVSEATVKNVFSSKNAQGCR